VKAADDNVPLRSFYRTDLPQSLVCLTVADGSDTECTSIPPAIHAREDIAWTWRRSLEESADVQTSEGWAHMSPAGLYGSGSTQDRRR